MLLAARGQRGRAAHPLRVACARPESGRITRAGHSAGLAAALMALEEGRRRRQAAGALCALLRVRMRMRMRVRVCVFICACVCMCACGVCVCARSLIVSVAVFALPLPSLACSFASVHNGWSLVSFCSLCLACSSTLEHVCMYIYIHTYIHARARACSSMLEHARARSSMYICINMYIFLFSYISACFKRARACSSLRTYARVLCLACSSTLEPVSMYIYIHTHIHARACPSTRMLEHARARARSSVRMLEHARARWSMYICMNIYIFLFSYVLACSERARACLSMRTKRTHAHTRARSRMYICMNMYIFLYIYIYYTHTPM